MDHLFKYWPYFLLAFSSLCLALLFQSVGLGTTHDSIAYLGTATSIAKGDGFQVALNVKYQHWPPIFPLILSVLGNESASIYHHALWLQFLMHFIATSLFFTLLHKQNTGTGLAVSIALLFGISAQTLQGYFFLWSEGIFITMFLAMLYFEQSGNSLHWWLRSLLPFQRFAGVIFAIRFPVSKRMLIQASLVLVPLFVWFLFQWHHHDRIAGNRSESNYSFFERLFQMSNECSKWILPAVIPAFVRIPSGCILLLIFFLQTNNNPVLKSIKWYFLSASLFLIGVSLFIDLEYFDDRFWIVQWTLFLLMIGITIRKQPKILLYLTILILCYNGIRGVKNIHFWLVSGGGNGFTSQRSELKIRDSHLLDDINYNIIVTDQLGYILPYSDNENREYILFSDTMSIPKENCTLILFNRSERTEIELKGLNLSQHTITHSKKSDLGVQLNLKYVGIDKE